MITDTADAERGDQTQSVPGERGALLAVLVMVVLGVAGIFAVSA